jgi:UDP-N-acetylmuramate--alanine ligase
MQFVVEKSSTEEAVFPSRRTAHFVGLGGAGMQALATVMHDRGWIVSGSDLQIESAQSLSTRGIRLFLGHAAANVPPGATILVRSLAVPDTNPEILWARRLQIPVCSYSEMLGRLTREFDTVAIAGTHGKSTVTAMVAEILICAGLDPTVICGATAADIRADRTQANIDTTSHVIQPFGGRAGTGRIAVVEACEYRENFLHLRPKVATVLNLEHDHFDYYRTPAQLIAAFERFILQVPEDGLIVASEDCHEIKEIARGANRHVVSFGVAGDADWSATNLEHSRGRYCFDLVRHGRRLTRVVLSVPGRHNVLNAAVAAAVARHCGVSVQHIAQGLASFRGLRRRLELRGHWGAARWIDDYAHHPTAVKAALETVRQMFPRRRLCCVFQPHQASRLTALLDEFAAVLHNADTIAVAEVYRAREGAVQSGEATAHELAARLRAGGCDVLDDHQPQAIAKQLVQTLQPGDVLVTLGAGDLGKIFDEFHGRIRRNRAVA